MLFLLLDLSAGTGMTSGMRDSRMFYISSSTTTSTLKTSTVCFKSGTALATCSKKKKRRALEEEPLEEKVKITPSQIEDDLEDGFESSKENMRDPKFLLYWATLTSTSTSTSYTATQTVYSLECTPTGFGTSLC